MGATYEKDEPVTLCAVLNGLRMQRTKVLTLHFEGAGGEVVDIVINRKKPETTDAPEPLDNQV